MADDEWYKGADGNRYLEHRSGAQSDHNQSLRARLFSDLSDKKLKIVDFGCGTGGVLSLLRADVRVGVEVGTAASEMARAKGIHVVNSLAAISNESMDVAISFHALEHVDDPLGILTELRRTLKCGGRVRVVVPCEMPIWRYQRSWQVNKDRHLFTWTPLILGNLANRAGFEDIVVRLEPMPTGSFLVGVLRYIPVVGTLVHLSQSLWRNSLNVILDARRGVDE